MHGTAYLEGGITRRLSELAVGDRVLTINSDGQLSYDDVMMFLHRDVDNEQEFAILRTESGKQITLTPNHLIKMADDALTPASGLASAYAREVRANKFLYTVTRHGTVVADRVVEVRTTRQRGVVAPLTTTGTIVVDDVIASCYAVIKYENVAHAAFAPVRFWYSISDWLRPAANREPALNRTAPASSARRHWYAEILYKMAAVVIPDTWLVHS